MLVTGEGAGPKKIADAGANGIEVMTELEFLDYIQRAGSTDRLWHITAPQGCSAKLNDSGREAASRISVVKMNAAE